MKQGIMNQLRIISFYLIFILLPISLFSAGTVYLVLGSDTAIWDGMSTSRYHDTYDQSLFTDPLQNAYKVMDPAFRAPLVDSYGTPMKMTWWMMAGNIFRYATNNNFPINNIMTMYLMKKYHGENVIANGDELTLHYHTFAWTDYDQDGLYHWNQALTFEESRDDWDFTLAQFLLEEDVFPVSFRSGWHFMDNTWQAELNQILPYSMHNAWPSYKATDEEPYANVIDWRFSPSEWVPYHPSAANYQLPGEGPGWNLRSAHFNTALARGYMDSVFAHAANGEDQVPCFWGHLPETDFADNMIALHEAAVAAAEKYPTVNFKYCTAVEAMQLWRGTADIDPPVLTLTPQGSPGSPFYRIQTNEPLFMPQPFVALKLKDNSYHVLECTVVDDTTWETPVLQHPLEIAKIGVAATDTAGNLSTEFIPYVGDDIFVDNLDPGYTEYAGSWSDSEEKPAWGTDSRVSTMSSMDPGHIGWTVDIPQDGPYHVFYQVPAGYAHEMSLNFVVHSSSGTDTVFQMSHPEPYKWQYLATPHLIAGHQEVLEMISVEPYPTGTATMMADAIKLSPLVREKDFRVSSRNVDFGPIAEGVVTSRTVRISNRGIEKLTIASIQGQTGQAAIDLTTPLELAPMSEIDLEIQLSPQDLGALTDTIRIASDDPLHPYYDIAVTALVEPPFYLVDNDDTTGYFESGDWRTSVAQAWGQSSRYAFLNNGAWAKFSIVLPDAGTYKIQEIVPTTVNSSDDALYIVKVDGSPIDSVHQDQNAGSGAWVTLGEYTLPADETIDVEVWDTGNSQVSGVLRADAIIFRMQAPGVAVDPDQSGLPRDPILYQNFPNPFNPTTSIRYFIPEETDVQLRIFDVTGREILGLNEHQVAGQHQLHWNGTDKWGNSVSTGIYLCQLQTAGHIQTIKMIYLR
ncbi:MAG: T9SS type A sorting domain-containing protein [Candidatus Marinimicrobia bacterium]|nr:T9SS type A sorting domain-containing protein [Candidatus Neomarinimicrobiota bacterium]MCF7851516.1 T9SS type A sorting domain-containing protein [Candidatus Neomarinimicrobiota bacterium]